MFCFNRVLFWFNRVLVIPNGLTFPDRVIDYLHKQTNKLTTNNTVIPHILWESFGDKLLLPTFATAGVAIRRGPVVGQVSLMQSPARVHSNTKFDACKRYI